MSPNLHRQCQTCHTLKRYCTVCLCFVQDFIGSVQCTLGELVYARRLERQLE